jgi:hypothetical protein
LRGHIDFDMVLVLFAFGVYLLGAVMVFV